MEFKRANRTAVTWAHAVNSQQELTYVFSSDTDMIEADVVMGKLNNSGSDIPVMAHPPTNTSDLTLDLFLKQIKQFNDDHPDRTKGIKLDFKSIEVFEESLEILQKEIPKITYPIWLNADIISGPVNQHSTIPVDPKRFFKGCSLFPKAVLSIGWTTRWNSEYNNGSYSFADTEAMQCALTQNNITESGQPITFPVRAGIAANSQSQLHDLVRATSETNESTLTIWSSQHDYVDIDKLRKLILSFGVDSVYLDVPEELSLQLNLGDYESTEGSVTDLNTLGIFGFISVGIILFSVWIQKAHI